MISYRLLVAFASVAIGGTAVACRSASPYEADAEESGLSGLTVVVRNENFNDVDVYALAGALPRRLGTVTGNSTQSFSLGDSFFSGTSSFRLEATPIAGSGRATTGALQVSKGGTVRFTVGARLAQSSVSVQ